MAKEEMQDDLNQDDLQDKEEKKGLTDWKNPPKLEDLKQDFSDAKPIHDAQAGKIREWLDNLNIEGKAKVNSRAGNSSIVPKMIRKQAEWRYAALTEPFLSTDDLFNVTPVTWEDRDSAQQNQLVLNNQFNTKLDKVRFIDEYVRAAVDEGSVICKVGWCFEEREEEEVKGVFEFQQDPTVQAIIEQIAQLKDGSPSQFATDVADEWKQALEISVENGAFYKPIQTGEEKVTVTKTVANYPTAEVCDYRNVVIDPTCKGDINKANFIVYTFPSSLAELKKDKKYSNLDQIDVTSNGPLAEPDYGSNSGDKQFNFTDKPRKKLLVKEYWGFWDINKDGLIKPFVASWVGNVLIRMEENPFPDKKLPFTITQYLPVRGETYGEPDGVLIEDNQKVAGAVTRGMIDLLAKSANSQTGVRKDMLDITNRRKFDKGEDYEFNGNTDPRQGIFMHQFAQIPESAQYMLNLQNQEAESLTGVRSFSQGISGNSLGDVAAGVRGALDAASKRELGILRRLSKGIEDIGRKFISMNAEFLSDEEVVRITNDTFVKIRRDDLAGDYDLKLSISTAEEDNNKAQELGFLLQTIGNNMDQDLRNMILSDIAKLRKMPDLAKRIESYQPQPDPLAVQKAQLELALLQAQIATEQAKAASLGGTANLANTKVGTEMAKQDHIKSDTDKKNLDFVEQESGVKQQRELQKQDEQAMAQSNLRVLDHNLQQIAAKTEKK